MAWLRRLWHGRDWMLVPLGGAVIVTAMILALSLAGWFERGNGYRPPRFGLSLIDLSYADSDSEPTGGMRFAASIHGTITDAPVLRAPMVDPRVAAGTTSGRAHEDVARFLRAWPGASLIDRGEPAETSHLALMPEDFAIGGRLILRDGCLRIVKQGWDEERLVVPLNPIDLFRDEENYLAIGAFEGPQETRLRIGEPGGLIRVMPVHDSQLEGLDGYRALCGDAPIVLLHSAKRLPDCSAGYLAAEKARRPPPPVQQEGSKAAEACRRRFETERALGRPNPVPCPPTYPIVPPPLPADIADGGVCRHPDEPIPDTPRTRV